MTPVFVLTLSDVIGLAIVGLLVIGVVGFVIWAKLDLWVRSIAKKNSEPQP